MPDPLPNNANSKEFDREIESWTNARSHARRGEIAHNTENLQARNRAWREALPMPCENWDKTGRIPSTAEA